MATDKNKKPTGSTSFTSSTGKKPETATTAKKPEAKKVDPLTVPNPVTGEMPVDPDFVPVEEPQQGVEIPDYVPAPIPAVQPAVTDKWVARIQKFLHEQVELQLDHEQYDEVIKELKKEL